MPKLFLGVLAVAWIVVLVPPVLRARNDSRTRGDSIGDFQNRLGVLGRNHSSRRAARAARSALPANARPSSARSPLGRPSLALPSVSRAPRPLPLTGPVEPVRTVAAERSARRRREVVTVLFTATVLSAAVASAVGGGVLWSIQILADLLLIAYGAGMLWFRSAGVERLRRDRARTVHYLPQVRPRPAPAYALRRTGSS